MKKNILKALTNILDLPELFVEKYIHADGVYTVLIKEEFYANPEYSLLNLYSIPDEDVMDYLFELMFETESRLNYLEA